MAHGGKRKNAGRKPKADEIKLIETMDAVTAPIEVWERLYSKVLEEDVSAIRTWLSYRYGMPRQMIDHTTDGEKLQQTIPIVLPNGKTLNDFTKD